MNINRSTLDCGSQDGFLIQYTPPTIAPPPGPAPPPRTSVLQQHTSKPAIETPPPYLDVLAAMPQVYLTRPITEPYIEPAYAPSYYFFYGTLMQPAILQ